MGAGLTIYNDRFNLQIDADYTNLALHPTVILIPSGRSSSNTIFETWGITPIFAVQPNPHGYYVNIHKNEKSYYQGTGKVYSFEDTPALPLSSGLGLELYDTNGSISYTSSKKSITILDYIKINIASGVHDFWSKNYGHTNIAVIPTKSPLGFAIGSSSSGDLAYGLAFKLLSTGMLTASMEDFASVPSGIGNATGNTFDVEFLVVNVTNY